MLVKWMLIDLIVYFVIYDIQMVNNSSCWLSWLYFSAWFRLILMSVNLTTNGSQGTTSPGRQVLSWSMAPTPFLHACRQFIVHWSDIHCSLMKSGGRCTDASTYIQKIGPIMYSCRIYHIVWGTFWRWVHSEGTCAEWPKMAWLKMAQNVSDCLRMAGGWLVIMIHAHAPQLTAEPIYILYTFRIMFSASFVAN